jgi:hypothetical protein
MNPLPEPRKSPPPGASVNPLPQPKAPPPEASVNPLPQPQEPEQGGCPELAACNPMPEPMIPSKAELVDAYQAFGRGDMLKWGGSAPAAGDILDRVPLSPDRRGFDMIHTDALVLRDNQVVFHKTGGIAGLNQYTQPLSLDRLPM